VLLIQGLFSRLKVVAFLCFYRVGDEGQVFKIFFGDGSLHGIFVHLDKLFLLLVKDLLDVGWWFLLIELLGHFFEED